MIKTNSFLKFLKNINKTINNLLEKNLNKLNFNNLRILITNNKIILTIVALLILFVSYLLIPTFFKQTDVVNKLNSELSEKLKLDFKFSQNIEYNIFPKPHFISYETSIFGDNYEISDIKKLKIYISLDNLFSLNNIKIQKIKIYEANFNLNKKNYNFFLNLQNNNFYDYNLEILNSNVFFKNLNDEVLFINKILKMQYFYDNKEFKNITYSENEIFNIPYNIKFYQDESKNKFFSKINLNILKLKIENEFSFKDKIGVGNAKLTSNKSKSFFSYKTDKNFFEFNFVDKLENPNFSYIGMFNLNPFYSSLNGKTQKIDLKYLINSNEIIPQLLKTEIFNNKNIDFKLNLKADSIQNNLNFVNVVFNSKIQEALIDIDNSELEWRNFAKFNISDSLIYINDGQIILDGKVRIEIRDSNEIYKYLLTPKNYRKNLNTIDMGFSYNFDEKSMSLKDINIDKIYNDNINKIINKIILKDNNLQNKIYLKNLLNEAIKSYAG